MRTVAIISQKGGSGKTTIAVHLAVCSERHGKATAILDMDPQGSASVWRARRQANTPDVVSATPAQLPSLLKQGREAGAQLVVIDTAPHTATIAATVAQFADLVLIPCRPSTFDLAAIDSTLRIVQLSSAKAAVVLNSTPVRGTLAQEARQSIQDRVTVSPVVLHQRIAYAHAVIDGRSVQEYEAAGRAAQEIERLYRWLIKTIPN
jgi:chromosome partitioning protein